MDYKQLKFANDHDEIVVFQTEDGKFVAIGGKKDENGDYRDSGLCDTKEEVLHSVDSCNGYLEETLKDLLPNWTFIDSIPPKLATVPAKTKVKILDCAEEECKRGNLEWDNEKKEMIGSICKIKDINGGDYRIWNENDSDYEMFPRSAFTVVLGEETTDKMEEAMALLKKNGYKIIK